MSLLSTLCRGASWEEKWNSYPLFDKAFWYGGQAPSNECLSKDMCNNRRLIASVIRMVALAVHVSRRFVRCGS